MNAKLVGAICVGEICTSVLDNEDVRAAVERVGAVLRERVFGDLDFVSSTTRKSAMAIIRIDAMRIISLFFI